MHSCDNPPCANPAHLSWGTGAENVHDAIAKGRHRNCRPHGKHYRCGVCGGEAHTARTCPQTHPGKRILSEAEAFRVLATVGPANSHGRTDRIRTLAAELGVPFWQVEDVARRKTWRHLAAPASARGAA